MADYYHLIFEDWDASMRRQGAAIARLLPPPDKAGPILDIACGIGTQSLALAALGYAVTGSDISAAEVARRTLANARDTSTGHQRTNAAPTAALAVQPGGEIARKTSLKTPS
jgi:2-polyprenyl-3-methyl-5-hydroxy-6-metoxy-1,4-benzoquinol methylase